MKAVIMAGGRGARLMPLTKNLPKPLVPILDKPVLHYILTLVKETDIQEAVITLGYLGQEIERVIGNGEQYGLKVRYVYENEPLGTAGGVKNASKYLNDDFLVLSGDAYTNIDLSALIRYHYSKKALITLATHREKDPTRFGVVLAEEDGKIFAFQEKPKRPLGNTVNMGIYVVDKNVLSMIPNRFCDFAKDVFPSLLGQMYAYPSACYWSDIGTLASYYMTNYEIVTGQLADSSRKVNTILKYQH